MSWLPIIDARLILTIAGPDGLTLRREFEAGQAPSLSLFDTEGNRLPDGSYTWELHVLARREADARQKRTRVRDSGEEDAPGKLPERPRVQFGYFAIRDGSFVIAEPPTDATLDKDLSEGGNLTVKGNACIGSECVIYSNGTNTDANFPVLKLKGPNLNILFDDVEVVDASGAVRNWALRANPSDADQFSLFDVDSNTLPVSVAGGAPDNSLFVRSNGDIGLGTSTPAEKLHVFENEDANSFIQIENPNAGTSAAAALRARSDTAIVNFQAHGSGRTLSRFGQTLAGWAEFLQVSGNGFILGTYADKPLILGTNSTNRMQITAAGDVGIGTASPAAPLHVSRSTGGILEGIRLSNNNEARITIQNTGLAATPKYIMAVNNTSPGLFFISRDGGGGTILEVNQRLDASGAPAVNVNGSIQATNVTFTSSRDLKEDFAALDPREVLTKVAALPITRWKFKEGPKNVEHIGPMAEDFHSAFGLNQDSKTISMTDTSGVALAAIQALLHRVEELEKQNGELAQRLQAMETVRHQEE